MTEFTKEKEGKEDMAVRVKTLMKTLEAMSNAEIANIRGLGLRGYKEILEKLGRNDGIKRTDRKDIGTI